ncbi:MAG: CoA transferase [Rhodoferax sp.]|nr:CoA transferase [Rhodoferax sp.]
MVIAAGSDHLFRALSTVLERADMASDPRFASRRLRVENQAVLKSIIESVLAQAAGSRTGWSCWSRRVPAGPLNDVQAMMADPR